MSRLVLDCSVTMGWCFEDEANEYTESVLAGLSDGGAAVPSIWLLEVANVLAIAERKGRTNSAKVARFLEILSGLPIVVDEQTSIRAFSQILSLARTQQLTSYDAAYLDLAMREGLPLATQDSVLQKAATKAGVRIFGN